MRNITVSVDEETYRRARIRAAELDTSVSALVSEFLQGLAVERPGASEASESVGEAEHERGIRLMHEVLRDIRARGGGLRMADNLPRDALYERNAHH